MKQQSCDWWRGAIALEALGQLDETERVSLVAHVEGCASCAATLEELRATNALLANVDFANLEGVEPMPSRLVERILGGLRADASQSRRRRLVRRAVAATSGLVAASLLAVVLIAVTASPRAPGERVVALRGTASVSGTVTLSSRPWGTSLALDETGLRAGVQYTVSMETWTGRWWVAGTYRANRGSTNDVTMACSVWLRQISGVRVQNARGVTVLSSYV